MSLVLNLEIYHENLMPKAGRKMTEQRDDSHLMVKAIII